MTRYALSWAEQYEEVETGRFSCPDLFSYPDLTDEVRIRAQNVQEELRPPSPAPYDVDATEAIRPQFSELATRWKRERPGGGTIAKMLRHPAYQAILQLGKDAIPLILEELHRENDFWYGALQELTEGVNPVSEADMGYLNEMRDAWLWWGYSLGYCRAPRSHFRLPEFAEDWIS